MKVGFDIVRVGCLATSSLLACKAEVYVAELGWRGLVYTKDCIGPQPSEPVAPDLMLQGRSLKPWRM